MSVLENKENARENKGVSPHKKMERHCLLVYILLNLRTEKKITMSLHSFKCCNSKWKLGDLFVAFWHMSFVKSINEEIELYIQWWKWCLWRFRLYSLKNQTPGIVKESLSLPKIISREPCLFYCLKQNIITYSYLRWPFQVITAL